MFRNPVQQALMLLTGAILAAALVAGSLLHKEIEPNAGAAPHPIRLACRDHVDNALCIVAEEKKFFQAAGVPVAALPLTTESPSETLLSGRADIACMNDTEAIIAISRHPPLRIIASQGGSRPGSPGDSQPLLLLATDKVLRQRPEMVRDLLATLQRAENFIHENPEETFAILSKATGLPSETIQRSVGSYEYRLRLDKPVFARLEDTAEALRTRGLIDQPPDLRRMADARYLPSGTSGLSEP